MSEEMNKPVNGVSLRSNETEDVTQHSKQWFEERFRARGVPVP